MRNITNMVAVQLAGAAIGSPYLADATTAKTLAEDLESVTHQQTASGGAVIRDNSWASTCAKKNTQLANAT